MTSEITYLKFLQKVNKGNTQFNITCDKARFVLIINEVKNRWVEKHIKFKDSILIDSLQEIVKEVEFLTGDENPEYLEYTLKSDFYEAIGAKSEVQKGTCDGVIYSKEIKNQNKNINQFDENLKPDFNFEWTFHTIQGNTLRVYKTDFKVLKTIFTYYQVIPEFDIEGYVNIDGQPSSNKPFTILSDQYVDQIINLAAEEFMRDFQDQNGLQIAKDRTFNQE
jgi:hypothetical protein